MKGVAHTDGGSRGNPGPAAAGFVLQNEAGGKLLARAFFLGQATNNVAEYTALVRALAAARRMGVSDLTIYTDSELMVRQLTGQYRVKSDLIQPLFEQVKELRSGFASCLVLHVTRDKNKEADRLVNKALDAGEDIEEPCEITGETARRLPHHASRRKPVRLGVLISGGGRTLLNLLECIKRGELNAEVSLVISSLSTVAGVERARNAGLPVKVIRRKDHPDLDAFSAKLDEELAAANVDLVVQGGWLCLWKIPPRYENRVMNIHPALLPSFGGKGMWGHHVHEAVLAAGCKVSGCTVHFCTNEYDRGPIIVQRTCPVQDDDTPDTLAERVFEQECLAYPEAIRFFAEGRLDVQENRVKVKSPR
ncbi:MAG TPA: phosphoribosylglycinamide formyltransferase [Sedimentisphaerales bacterium]|nr:phosphoribosylglycinamide formyltransferase [Sedimentisphaerales bacterium]